MAKKSQQFKVIIEQGEDGQFIASVPSLLGVLYASKNISRPQKKNQGGNFSLS